jgi:enoyl-CoA hydratase/carnithine racemase
MNLKFETLRLEAAEGTAPDDGIWVLTLNRPEVLNAMNTRLLEEMHEAIHQLAYEENLRVLIITGAGQRAFSAGGDLKERKGMSNNAWRRQHQLAEEVLLAIKDFPQPVIAAVEGIAHGGGCELALMCDFIIASREANFALPEAKRGILPGGGGIQNLVRAAGMRRAKQVIFCGDIFTGAEAEKWNVVNEVTEFGQALSSAVAVARRIIESAPMAVRYGKLAESRGGEVDFHTGYTVDLAAYNILVSSNDRIEGVLAFNEKRKPRWANS